MARRNQRYHRRRRGNFALLLRVLGFVLATAAIVAGLTVFFRVETVMVTGNEKYSEEQVLAAAGIENGENLILLNKFAVAQRIFEQLPYAEETVISRKLPDTIVIEVRECRAAASVKAVGGGTWLISARGTVLEKTRWTPSGSPPGAGTATPTDIAVVTGVYAADPQPSKPLFLGEEDANKCAGLLQLMQTAQQHAMLSDISAIDLSRGTEIVFTYLDRFTVHLPWTADFDYKLNSLAIVADRLEINETGTIDLMTDGKVSFIPE